MPKLTIKTFFNEHKEKLGLEMLNGELSFKRHIVDGDLHRPGLALTGFVDVFTYQRIQIIGNTETAYLLKMSDAERKAALKTLFSFKLPCIIITDSNAPVSDFLEFANKSGVSVFSSPYNTTKLMHLLSEFLDERFAPSEAVHGSMADVYGIGVLFTGRSGIGKSEIVLDLVERGHRLVADDIVHISRKAAGILIASASELLQHHMEVRGLGIVDIRSIFGIRSIRLQKRVEVEVQLEEWSDSADYDRIGLDETTRNILDVELPVIKLPIFPGKNITVIAEVIALNQLMKIYGRHPAQEFNDRLKRKMQQKASEKYLEDYLERDFE